MLCREANPGKFNNRVRNKMYYTQVWSKVSASHNIIMDFIDIDLYQYKDWAHIIELLSGRRRGSFEGKMEEA